MALFNSMQLSISIHIHSIGPMYLCKQGCRCMRYSQCLKGGVAFVVNSTLERCAARVGPGGAVVIAGAVNTLT